MSESSGSNGDRTSPRQVVSPGETLRCSGRQLSAHSSTRGDGVARKQRDVIEAGLVLGSFSGKGLSLLAEGSVSPLILLLCLCFLDRPQMFVDWRSVSPILCFQSRLLPFFSYEGRKCPV